MKVRRFNALGTEQFRAYLRVLRESPSTPLPSELIEDVRFSESVEPSIEIDARAFSDKFDAGAYLYQKLSSIPKSQLRIDAGLWSWLTLWFFDQICPRDGNGRRKPLKQDVPYIAIAGDYYYGLDKHFLFFPWKMTMLHGVEARSLLSAPLPKDSDEQRAWTGYYLNVSREIIRAFTRMYWNDAEKKIKRGALTHSKKARGTLRRFVQLLKQLEVTYDIQGMTADEMMSLLPKGEFGKWLTGG